MAKKALGRGLEALIPQQPAKPAPAIANELAVSEIIPNRDQPRKHFGQDELEELAASISSVGIIEPLVLRKKGDKFEIIAGERRWRAAQLAGLEKVPVVIKDVADDDVLELALIENLQREDLNPIEEAIAYQDLISRHNYRQEDLAKKLGKSRAAITNAIRLLGLPESVQQYLVDGKISAGHARALLSVRKKTQMETLARRTIEKNLSVRELEAITGKITDTDDEESTRQQQAGRDPELGKLESRLEEALGTKTIIKHGKKGGRIEINYYSADDLERILDIICQD
ncbi:MAG TPA: ParB/RepB/Spo0J family partition protein [Spirochaetota bacterium]|nr:ParB/RepB/Spo0J family partition protein [Spirochaetota bacterium]